MSTLYAKKDKIMSKIPLIDEYDLDVLVKAALQGKGLLAGDNSPENIKEVQKSGILKFTQKEISKMPQQIRKLFRTPDGVVARVRKKKNGVIEIRCMIGGVRYEGSGKDLATAKEKFIAKISKKNEPPAETDSPLKNSSFAEYSKHYLAVFKKPNICEKAYKNYNGILDRHIIPYFADDNVEDITASRCQGLLNGLLEDGKGRTAEDVKNLLKWILDTAITDKIITVNPMNSVTIPKHFRENGKQIPAAIIKDYLSIPPKSKYDYCLLTLIFSGMRPCELSTVTFDENFMTVKDAKKTKNEKQTYRQIPIHSFLRPYLDKIKEAISANEAEIGRYFRKTFPKEYRLYDLRHTFTTRIQECGATKEWVDYVTAHKAGKNTTSRVYTHFSEEFSVKQMEKLVF